MATDLGRTKAANPAKTEAFLEEQITRARKRIRAVDVAAAGLALAAGFLAYGLVMGLCDRAWVLPAFFRVLTFAVCVGAGVFYLIVRLVLPLAHQVNPLFAAKELERTLPGAKNSIVNWVDLHDDNLPPAIRAALTRRAAKDLSRADLDQAISTRRAVWAGAAAGGLLAGLFVFFLFIPGQFWSLMQRAYLPFHEGGIAAETRLSVLQPDGGNATVTENRPVTITVAVQGKIPPTAPWKGPVSMAVHTDDRGRVVGFGRVPPGVDPGALLLHLRYSQRGAYLQFPLEHDADNRWKITIPSNRVLNGFFYRVTGGDAETPEYQIIAKSPPAVDPDRSEVTYTYPGYLRKNSETRNDLHLKAVRTTRAVLKVRTNRALKEGSLEVDCGGDKTTLRGAIPAGEPDTLVIPYELGLNGSYRVRFTTKTGEEYDEPIRYGIDVIPDSEVKFLYRPYLGLKDEARRYLNLPDLTVLRGTRVAIAYHANRKLAGGTLEFRFGDRKNTFKGETQARKSEALSFAAFRPDRDGTYQLSYSSPDGSSVTDPRLYRIKVIPDNPPVVKLTKPGKEIELPANGLLQLEGKVTDDVGIKNVTLHMQVNESGQPTWTRLAPQPYRGGTALKTGTGRYPLDLDYKDFVELAKVRTEKGRPFALREGMSLVYWLEATDNSDYPDPKGQVGQSEHYRVVIKAPQKDTRKQEEKKQQAQKEQQQHEKKQDEKLANQKDEPRPGQGQPDQQPKNQEGKTDQQPQNEERKQDSDPGKNSKNQGQTSKNQGSQGKPDRKNQGSRAKGAGGEGDKPPENPDQDRSDVENKANQLNNALNQDNKGKKNEKEGGGTGSSERNPSAEKSGREGTQPKGSNPQANDSGKPKTEKTKGARQNQGNTGTSERNQTPNREESRQPKEGGTEGKQPKNQEGSKEGTRKTQGGSTGRDNRENPDRTQRKPNGEAGNSNPEKGPEKGNKAEGSQPNQGTERKPKGGTSTKEGTRKENQPDTKGNPNNRNTKEPGSNGQERNEKSNTGGNPQNGNTGERTPHNTGKKNEAKAGTNSAGNTGEKKEPAAEDVKSLEKQMREGQNAEAREQAAKDLSRIAKGAKDEQAREAARKALEKAGREPDKEPERDPNPEGSGEGTAKEQNPKKGNTSTANGKKEGPKESGNRTKGTKAAGSGERNPKPETQPKKGAGSEGGNRRDQQPTLQDVKSLEKQMREGNRQERRQAAQDLSRIRDQAKNPAVKKAAEEALKKGGEKSQGSPKEEGTSRGANPRNPKEGSRGSQGPEKGNEPPRTGEHSKGGTEKKNETGPKGTNPEKNSRTGEPKGRGEKNTKAGPPQRQGDQNPAKGTGKPEGDQGPEKNSRTDGGRRGTQRNATSNSGKNPRNKPPAGEEFSPGKGANPTAEQRPGNQGGEFPKGQAADPNSGKKAGDLNLENLLDRLRKMSPREREKVLKKARMGPKEYEDWRRKAEEYARHWKKTSPKEPGKRPNFPREGRLPNLGPKKTTRGTGADSVESIKGLTPPEYKAALERLSQGNND